MDYSPTKTNHLPKKSKNPLKLGGFDRKDYLQIS